MPKWKVLKEQHSPVRAAVLLSITGQAVPPVDLDSIVDELGIKLIKDREMQVDGYLEVTDEDVATIGIRQCHRNRQRFTLAHEIGHLMLHDPITHGLPDSSGKRHFFRDVSADIKRHPLIEQQANAFAADLLMPMMWLEIYGPARHWSPAELADAFGVSQEAMRVRLERFMGKK